MSGKMATLIERARRGHVVLAALCALGLAGCAFGDSGNLAYTSDSDGAHQPFPANYRGELLAFLRSYLNDPRGVRSAMLAEPAKLTVGGRQRYVTCLRYSARESDGSYGPARVRAVLYVDGRLDRLIEEGGETCAGATYAPFPELEKLSR